MKVLVLLFYLCATLVKLLRPGGLKAVLAENASLKLQFIVVQRKYKRAPNLKKSERLLFGFLASLMPESRLTKSSVILKPATLLKFHKALCKLKYRLIFGSKSKNKPGPKCPSVNIIRIIVEMKQRNPRYGYRRIAMQISNNFDVDIDKDIVRRVLEKSYKSKGNDHGPSWLTFIGNMKDSLWSVDLFKCQSILLKSHWVMVVMD